MRLKGTKIYSILTFTCPRCHEGDLFVKKSAYTRGMAEMHKKCAHCGEPFDREPGFYYGAAYVSYALTIALWVAVFVALATFDALKLIEFSFFDDAVLFLTIGIALLLILLPLLYRLSRSIWINLFVKYRKDAVEFNRHRELERENRRAARAKESDRSME